MRPMIMLAISLFLIHAEDLAKPAAIRTSTWVREDLFAGYLDGDMTRFERGVKKVDLVISQNPKAADAWAWKASAGMYLAVRAYEAKDNTAFEAGYKKAVGDFAKSAEIVKEVPAAAVALHAIKGGTFAVFGDRLPSRYRREAWQYVRENYTALYEIQKAEFDKMPVHHRGEVMAGLAQAAERLGEKEKAHQLTREFVAALPGTPYAVFGKRWIDKPETMPKSKITCSSCHDAGRLEVALNRR